MKVEKIDFIWAAVSMIIVGVSFRRRHLPDGIIMIYVLMAAVFAYHIWKKKKSLGNGIPVFGKIVEYRTSQKLRGCFPVVRYTTEGGREYTSTYSVAERKPKYEVGDEKMICYDPEDPMSFYFVGREDEMTNDYFRFIIYGAPVALLMLFIR